MGASPQLRWVAIVAAMWFATAAPAVAQSSAGPDPAPSGSKSPSPDPAPVNGGPVVTARTPVRSTTPAPASPTRVAPATTAAKPAQHTTTTRGRKPARHQRKRHAPAAAKHRTVVHVPSLPHLNPARLVAPQTTDDAGRARRLAAGALSLLLLALASAILLAFTTRVERRRVVR